MSARAGIVVTGTEVLTGRVSDRNGPWLAERLRELGVDLAYTTIVGDRPRGHARGARVHGRAAARPDPHQRRARARPPTTSRPRSSGAFQGREMVLDEALEERIAEILRAAGETLAEPRPGGDRATANRKQATIPARRDRPRAGRHRARASSSRRAGTAASGPTVVVLPGPPRELQPMWGAGARQRGAARRARAARPSTASETLRLFGIPESEIAETLRVAERDGVELDRLEITTCLKRGEVEVVTRFEPGAQRVYDAFVGVVAAATPTRCSRPTAAPSTSRSRRCCAGGIARGRGRRARSPPPSPAPAGCWPRGSPSCPGASDYMQGGDRRLLQRRSRSPQAGVPPELIERHGAVSAEVAEALADGRQRARSARTSASASPASPGPAAAPRRSPSGSCG